MSFKIYNYYGGSWVDVSDYVVGAGDVPYISRNPDWTLRVESIGIEIAGSIQTGLPAGYSFSLNSKIKVEYNSAFLWGGYITDSRYNYDNQIYELEVTSSLKKLQEKLFGYDEMHATFITGSATQYWNDTAYVPQTTHGVQVVWALECAFSVNSLTLTVPSNLKTTVLFNKIAGSGWGGRQITYGDLFFDEYQLYCLKMPVAVKPATVINWYINRDRLRDRDGGRGGSTSHIAQKADHKAEIDCFDFVSECMTSLYLTLQQTDIDTFELIDSTANYTITDDDKYSYAEYLKEARALDVGISYATGFSFGDIYDATGDVSRSLYYLGTQTNITNYAIGGVDKITVMPNFTILFADSTDFTSAYNGCSADAEINSAFVLNDGTVDANINIVSARIKADSINKTIYEIECPVQTAYNTIVENFIDLEERTSRIIQETYA